MWNRLSLLVRDCNAQGQLEYTLILSLVAILLMAGLSSFSAAVQDLTMQIARAINLG